MASIHDPIALISSIKRHLLAPFLKPITTALHGSSIGLIDAIAYNWWILTIVSGLLVFADLGIWSFLACIVFLVGVYIIGFTTVISAANFPHATTNIVMLTSIAALCFLCFGSMTLAVVLFGISVGVFLGPPDNLTISFSIILICGSAGLLFRIAPHDTSRFAWLFSIPLVILVVGILFVEMLIVDMDRRTNRLMLIMLAYIGGSAAVVNGFFGLIPPFSIGVATMALFAAYSGAIFGETLNSYRRWRGHNRRSYLFRIAEQSGSNVAFFMVGYCIAILLIRYVEQRDSLFGKSIPAMGLGIFIVLPVMACNFPLQIALAVKGLCERAIAWWNRTNDPLEDWEKGVVCQVEAIQLPLPHTSWLLAEIAVRYGLTTALCQLNKYLRSSIEGRTAARALRLIVARDAETLYSICDWAVAGGFAVELRRAGRWSRQIRRASDILTILGAMEPESMGVLRFLWNRTWRRGGGPTRSLARARLDLCGRSNAGRSLGQIALTMELTIKAQKIDEFANILPELRIAVRDSAERGLLTNIVFTEQVLTDLDQLLRKSIGNGKNLSRRDCAWLEGILQQLELQQTLTLCEMLIWFVLTTLRELNNAPHGPYAPNIR
jgi:hypothetical protein